MQPREEFLTKGVEGARSTNIGWHFGATIPKKRNDVKCKFCGKVVKWGMTRVNTHLAHLSGNVAPCPRGTTLVREGMMKLLKDQKEKSRYPKRRIEEFEACLQGDVNDDFDEEETIGQTTQESIRSHKEWEER